MAHGENRAGGHTKPAGDAGASRIPPSSQLCLTSPWQSKSLLASCPAQGSQLTRRDGAGLCQAPAAPRAVGTPAAPCCYPRLAPGGLGPPPGGLQPAPGLQALPGLLVPSSEKDRAAFLGVLD